MKMLERFAFFQKLNSREQRLLSIFASVALVGLFVLLPVYLLVSLSFKRADVRALRSAVDAVQQARTQIRDRQSKKDALLARYQKRAPELGGLLDQSARTQKLEIAESNERPEVPIGTSKRYTERSTLVRIKKSGLLPLAEFLASLERTEYPVSVSRLNLRRRMGEKDSYDTEVVLSTFDRVADATAAKEGKK